MSNIISSPPNSSSPRAVCSPIIVALDFDHLKACYRLVDQLDPARCRLKIGKEMFTLFGPALVEELQTRGFEVFLDLKFHDIPNTVAKAVQAAASLGVWMVNVHASGGRRMLEAAASAVQASAHSPILIAVTVLTSMADDELSETGISLSAKQQVLHLADLTRQSGLGGVVCSAREASAIKQNLGDDFVCVTPGIRPQSSQSGDQRRVMTPAEALRNGSDYLVIGRPITQADDPSQALAAIEAELNLGLERGASDSATCDDDFKGSQP